MRTYTFHIPTSSAILIMCCITVIQAAQTPKIVLKNISEKYQLHVQQKVPNLNTEQDKVQELLTANEVLGEELATIKLSREVAKQEAQNARNELEQMKNAMKENQNSMDAILNDLQNAKKDLANTVTANEILRSTLTENYRKMKKPVKDGDLVPLTPDITPARPMNLNRLTIKTNYNSHSRGVVVVNVLVSENGEVLDAKLLQGLFGHGELVDKANSDCVEQAKRIIFDPAQTADGKTRVRVWQGVGILLN